MDKIESEHHYVRLAKGIAYFLLGWAFFTFMAAASRYAMKDISIAMILFFQNLIGLIFLVPWFIKHGTVSFKTSRLPLILMRGLCGIGGFMGLFLAVKHTSLVNAILLNNTAPIFIPFIVLAWLKVKIEHKLWPGIIIGFIGVAFVLKPGPDIFSHSGILFGLLAGVCLAFSMIIMRQLSLTERNHTVLFYYFLVGLILSAPFCFIEWTTPALATWLLILAIGLFSSLGQLAYVRAFHYAKASHLGPFCYVSVVFSGIVEWLLWDKTPAWNTYVGFILICLSGSLIILFSKPPPK